MVWDVAVDVIQHTIRVAEVAYVPDLETNLLFVIRHLNSRLDNMFGVDVVSAEESIV